LLPPDLAAFTFEPGAAASDTALASRVAAEFANGGTDGTVVVSGASRTGLLLALAARGLRVIAFDAVRGVLPQARRAAENAGVSDRVTLFAADPRDFEIPGGADAALLPCAAWRMLTHRSSRSSAIACFRRALRPGGVLLSDADTVPPVPGPGEVPLRTDQGGLRWTLRAGPDPGPGESPVVALRGTSPSGAASELLLCAASPDAWLGEIRADRGFDAVLDRSGPRAFVVARVRGEGKR
jgi:SAM-dependent methyltransferase